MFLYAGIVCTVVKPEQQQRVVKIESNNSMSVQSASAIANDAKPKAGISARTLYVFGIR